MPVRRRKCRACERAANAPARASGFTHVDFSLLPPPSAKPSGGEGQGWGWLGEARGRRERCSGWARAPIDTCAFPSTKRLGEAPPTPLGPRPESALPATRLRRAGGGEVRAADLQCVNAVAPGSGSRPPPAPARSPTRSRPFLGALRRERALALPETAHLAHAAPNVDREDIRILVEAGRPGPAPATLGEPAGPVAAHHLDDEKVRELPHHVVDVGKALAGAEPELGRLPVVFAAAAVVRHRSRGSFRPEAWEARRSRGARSATDPIYFNLRAVLPRARCSAAAAGPRPGRRRPSPAAAGEVRSALNQVSPGR